jgi:hypothetical protein
MVVVAHCSDSPLGRICDLRSMKPMVGPILAFSEPPSQAFLGDVRSSLERAFDELSNEVTMVVVAHCSDSPAGRICVQKPIKTMVGPILAFSEPPDQAFFGDVRSSLERAFDELSNEVTIVVVECCSDSTVYQTLLSISGQLL